MIERIEGLNPIPYRGSVKYRTSTPVDAKVMGGKKLIDTGIHAGNGSLSYLSICKVRVFPDGPFIYDPVPILCLIF